MSFAPNKSPCAELAARLAQAQSIKARNEGYFQPGGQYNSYASELGFMDYTSMTSTAGGFATAMWQLQAGSLPTQKTTALPLGATYFPNNVGYARVVAGVNMGVGIASTTMSAAAFAHSYETGDTAGMMLNGANTVYGVAGFIPGVGIVFAGAQTAVNGALFAYQVSVEVTDRQNTRMSAQASKNTIGVADRVIGDVSKEMAEKGCK